MALMELENHILEHEALGVRENTDGKYLRQDGTKLLTANWAVGAFEVTGITVLETDEITNRGGDLKIEPNVEGDVTLFEDTDIADDSVGKKLYIYRKAAEGDRSIQFFIDDVRVPTIAVFSDLSLNIGTTEEYRFDSITADFKDNHLTTTGTITASNFITSTIVTGTQPYACTSDTLNTNLNADMLDGKHTGTSGNVVPLLDGNNIYSGTSQFNDVVTITATGSPQLKIGYDANNELSISIDSSGNTSFATDGGDFLFSDSATNKPLITLENANDDTLSAILKFNKNTLNPADRDQLGEIQFWGKNSSTANTKYASIVGKSEDITAATEDGSITFNLIIGGTLRNIIEIKNTGINSGLLTFNQDSIDMDSVFETNNDPWALYINGGTDEIGFSTNNPTGQVEIESRTTTIAKELLTLDQNDANQAFYGLEGTSSLGNGNNISTTNGDGVVTGPKDASTKDGWTFAGMFRVKINTTDYWVPFYSFDLAP